jgi:flagellar hook-associated protein 3 FlgL
MTSVSSYGTIGRTLTAALATRDRLDLLTRQASSGRIAETFGGLAPNARVSIDLRTAIARRDAYGQAIATAESRIAVMQPALGRIGEIAINATQAAMAAVTQGRISIPVLAQAAREALVELASTLNVTAGDDYVFNGSDTSRPPIPNANAILQSGFFTQIRAAVQQFGQPWDHDANPLTPDVPRGASQVMADTLAIAASTAPGTTPFSPHLEGPGGAEPRLGIVADDGQRVTYGLRANANGLAQSRTDPPSTGSFIRDIMRGLAVLGSLDEDMAGIDDPALAGDDFEELLLGISRSLQSAVKTLEEERGALGVAEQRLEALKQRHLDMMVVLKAQVGKVEDVDLAEVSARLQLLQTQLEMSYRLIAGLRDLNLARYL